MCSCGQPFKFRTIMQIVLREVTLSNTSWEEGEWRMVKNLEGCHHDLFQGTILIEIKTVKQQKLSQEDRNLADIQNMCLNSVSFVKAG